MPPLTDEQRSKLLPFLTGAQPDERGEVEMYCPLHPDTRRSASLNVNMGVWYCHAKCGGGSVRRLLDSEDLWISPEGRTAAARPVRRRAIVDPKEWTKETTKRMRRWHQRLLEDAPALDWLWRTRGLRYDTVRRARLGYDGRRFKIPVFSPERNIWNIRTYDPEPGEVRRKIWGERGHNAPRLYPIGIFNHIEDAVLICEGEWDALLAIQSGIPAITRTGAALVWNNDWNHLFHGLRVYICHDADEMGQDGNNTVAKHLWKDAAEVRIVDLGYEVRPKHGKDLTDFVMENGAAHLLPMIRKATIWHP